MLFEKRVIATGAGFVVNSRIGPLLITNRHNVTGRNQNTGQPFDSNLAVPDEVAIIHNHVSNLGSWIRKEEPLFHQNDTPIWFEHTELKSRADFVELPLSQLESVQLYPCDLLGPENKPIQYGVAEVVSVIGFPFGMSVGGSFAI